MEPLFIVSVYWKQYEINGSEKNSMRNILINVNHIVSIEAINNSSCEIELSTGKIIVLEQSAAIIRDKIEYVVAKSKGVTNHEC